MEELEMNTEISEAEGLSVDKQEESTSTSVCESDEENDVEDVTNSDAKTEEDDVTVDYGEIERQDLEELRSIFPHLKNKTSIMELNNPLRYAALRDLGLTPKEAYLATNEPQQTYDNRSHLRSSVPKSASAPQNILSRGELEAARELFSGLSDREIQKLYKKVSR